MENLGPYQLLERLAVGGMGATYLARRHGSSELRVLKLRLATHSNSALMDARFAREGRIGAQLRHRNVAALVDAAVGGERAYLVFEHVAGPPLSHVLESWARSGPPPVEVVVHLALGILAGLHHLHELRDEDGAPLFAVHRDVSPGNVVIGADGVPKLIDLGLVRASGGDWRTESRVIVGTAQYVPPEIAVGDTKYADRRADIFSVGILIYEMLTARPMFPNGTSIASILPTLQHPDYPPVAHVRADVPARLSHVVARALAPQPDDRWPHALAFADALRQTATASSDAEVARALGDLLEKERESLEPVLALARAAAAAEGDVEPTVEPTRSSQPPTDGETVVVRQRRNAQRGVVVDLRLHADAPEGVSADAAFNSSEMLRSVLPTRVVQAPRPRAYPTGAVGFVLGAALMAAVWWLSTPSAGPPSPPAVVITPAQPMDAAPRIVVPPVEVTAMSDDVDGGVIVAGTDAAATSVASPARSRRDASAAVPAQPAVSEASILRGQLRAGTPFQVVLEAARLLAERRGAPARVRAALEQAESTGDTDTLERALRELE